MRYVKDFTDYEMIDTSGGEKLERWGDKVLVRPDPQIIWDTPKENPLWKKADARYLICWTTWSRYPLQISTS